MTILSSNLIEAANRAEATALLIRCGYKVYRPEADTSGEDLVVRFFDGALRPVQLKGRATVSAPRYSGLGLWMLFPDRAFDPGLSRDWYLTPHDELHRYVERRHGQAAGWSGSWSYPSMPRHLRDYLEPWQIRPAAE